MTFTKQIRCLPAKVTTELSSSPHGKFSKTETDEVLDDMNSLYDSLCVLNSNLRKLDLLIQKKLTEQNQQKNASFD